MSTYDPIALGVTVGLDAIRAAHVGHVLPDVTITLPHAAAEWLVTFMSDVLNDDFLGEYQREHVGPIPGAVVEAFNLDPVDTAEWFGDGAK